MPKSDSSEKSKYSFRTPEHYLYKSKKGLSRGVVETISEMKKEPEWMCEFRIDAYETFLKTKMPSWGPDLSAINFQDIYYYIHPTEKKEADWSKLPEDIRKTFDRLGIPEAEKKFLAGSSAQYESDVVYCKLKEEWEAKGIIFTDMDTAVREHASLVREYMGKLVPPADNKFAALNSAVWSGGSFIYIPKGVQLQIPLQAYFRINAQKVGQFERTLIIADEGGVVSYIEGCTAPIYSAASLHAAVVEVFAKKNSRVRYTTIQNWSTNVYNLVTKRSIAYENALVEWIDGNLGSKLNMKYPAVILKEPGARADMLSIAYAGKGQIHDNGAKIFHLAPDTSSRIISKSISRDGGRASYRGLVSVAAGARGTKAHVRCDALILDKLSRSDSYPTMKVDETQATVTHEATVGRISDEQLFYAMSRGIKEDDALAMIVLGFFEQFTKELPMEYAVELNRLIGMQLEKSHGFSTDLNGTPFKKIEKKVD